jgi:hypothetical protein
MIFERHIMTFAEATLLVTATVFVFVPEMRTVPMKAVVGALFAVLAAVNLRTIYKAGLLTKTPRQILAMPGRPKFSVVGTLATWMAMVALIMIA